jgi:hypothetical protein
MYDILEVLRELNVSVEESGTNNYVGLCPFHTEKTPSFTVFLTTNSWYCFGCGEGSSVFDLVMKIKNISFYEAKQWLQETFLYIEKIELPSLTPKQVTHRILRNKYIDYWHNLLLHTKRDMYFIKRKFSQETIHLQGFGWDGKRYIIPVWQGRPRFSRCLGVRKRASELLPENSFKYIGKKGYNHPYIWGKYHTQNSNYMFIFAGELDGALAVQDGLPAVSIVGGVLAYNRFPLKWPFLWFPHIKNIIVVFDKKECVFAGNIASKWELEKGRGTSSLFHWVNDVGTDYNEFRIKNTVTDFIDIVLQQGCFNGNNNMLQLSKQNSSYL